MLAREFNLRTVNLAITVHAARKWLTGEAIPTQDRMSILAGWLNVTQQWLRFGEGPMTLRNAKNDENLIPHDEVVLLTDFRLLDSRSQEVVREMIASMLKHRRLST